LPEIPQKQRPSKSIKHSRVVSRDRNTLPGTRRKPERYFSGNDSCVFPANDPCVPRRAAAFVAARISVREHQNRDGDEMDEGLRRVVRRRRRGCTTVRHRGRELITDVRVSAMYPWLVLADSPRICVMEDLRPEGGNEGTREGDNNGGWWAREGVARCTGATELLYVRSSKS